MQVLNAKEDRVLSIFSEVLRSSVTNITRNSKSQCFICNFYKFLGIASRLIMTNLSRTLKSGP